MLEMQSYLNYEQILLVTLCACLTRLVEFVLKILRNSENSCIVSVQLHQIFTALKQMSLH